MAVGQQAVRIVIDAQLDAGRGSRLLHHVRRHRVAVCVEPYRLKPACESEHRHMAILVQK